MAKLGNPFVHELWITQTYHSGSNNTAIDISAVAGTPVYALADGKVTYRSSGYGSYCIQTLDNSDLKVYYVHTYNWVGANTSVKKGQKICEVAPTSVNGGYPTHIHLGLPIGKNIMDYFDRSIVFRTKYQAIKDIWFTGENLNWAKFKDLSYNNTMTYKVGDTIEFTGTQNIRKGAGDKFEDTGDISVGQTAEIISGPRTSQNEQFNLGANDSYTWWDIKLSGGGTGWVADVGKWKIYVEPVKPPTPPEPPVQTECEKQVVILNKRIQALALTTGTQGAEIKALESVIEEKNKKIVSLEAEVEEGKKVLSELQKKYDVLDTDKKRIEEERSGFELDLDKCEKKLAEGKKNFIKKITDKIGEWLGKLVA